MNLNNESHFATSPIHCEMPRSTFSRDFDWKGTFNAGKLVPFYVDEALPGDTYSMKTTALIRMTTPLYPVLDRCFADVYYFFVPWRLVWSHTKEFFGENSSTTAAWTQTVEYTLPKINLMGVTRTPGDIAHCMGVPLYLGVNTSIVSLPFRAYRLIYNEFFRDQNTQPCKLISVGDSDTDTSLVTDLLPVCRVHDYFGSCLPGPQKGATVSMAISGELPVTTRASDWTVDELKTNKTSVSPLGSNYALQFYQSGSSSKPTGVYNTGVAPTSGKMVNITGLSGTASSGSLNYYPSNLMAQLDYANYGISVNDLRYAVQSQRILEALALGGSRYTEYLSTFFGIRSADARLQRPELIGSARFEINMADNVQNAPGGSGQTPLSTVGAYSKTVSSGAGVNYSVQENGYVLGLLCVRHDRSYSQGLSKMWRRTNMFSVYNPKLAFISEQPVMKSELCAEILSDEPFGWQEAWAEYRYKPNVVSGLLDPVSQTSGSPDYDTTALGAYWTYCDYYNVKKSGNTAPTLSADWMNEGDEAIARTLAIQNEDQFIADIYVSNKHTRVMPVFSVPGLADHF